MEQFDWNTACERPTAHFHQRLCDTLAALPETAPLPAPRRRNFRRTALIAFAAAVLLCFTAFAAELMIGYGSSSNLKDTVHTLSAAAGLAEKFGLKATLPSEFSNGFRFASALPGTGQGVDPDGQPLAEHHNLMVEYRRGKERLSLHLAPGSVFSAEVSQSSTAYGGVTLYTATITFITVPKGYQPTAEEQALADSGAIVFSCNGGSTREEDTGYFVNWLQNNTGYSLYASSKECNLTADGLLAMAKEIVDAG